jgi:hypothetical protein
MPFSTVLTLPGAATDTREALIGLPSLVARDLKMCNFAVVLSTFLKYPGFVLMRSIARFEVIRNLAVHAQTLMRQPLDRYVAQLRERTSEFFTMADPAAFAEALDRDGFSLGLSLSAATVRDLVEYALANHCWADRDPAHGFSPGRIEQARQKLGRRFLLAQYFNTRQRCPLIARLVEDPVLLEIAARYLGTVPKLVGVGLWWSYAEEADAHARNRAAQMIHFDLDDFKFVKFFFYLTDVDSTAGPHVIVRATHRDKSPIRRGEAIRIRRYSDEEVETAFGKDRIVSIMGPAGTGFVEDTLCLHKGAVPTARSRLLLQVQYALNDFHNQNDELDESRLALIA